MGNVLLTGMSHQTNKAPSVLSNEHHKEFAEQLVLLGRLDV